MTKSFALIAQNIRPEQSKVELVGKMAQFTRDLRALEVGDASRSILPASSDLVKKDLKVVQDAWAAYEVLLNENMDTIRDADGNINTTVIEMALDLNKPIVKYSEEVVKLIVAESIVAGEDGSEATLVDICERQLMLIHELNKEFVLVAMGIKKEYYLGKVLDSLELFQNSHEGIIRGAEWAGIQPLKNACILNEMRNVTQDWLVVLPKLMAITTAPSITESQELAMEGAEILTQCCDKLAKSMEKATYSITHSKTTCGDMKAAITEEEWLNAIQSAEKQNYLVAKATQLFMQIALGFEVSQSQVDLTVLTESVGQDLGRLIEGDLNQNLVVPPEQEIVDLLFLAQAAWTDLETELKKSVRSADIPSTSIKEVARLSRLALTNMASAVSLYVKSGIASGTPAPVYAIDLASSQRSALEKLAKETSLLSYGYDPTNSWIRLNTTRQKFIDTHWKLLKGYPASGVYPPVDKATNICIIQQMSSVFTWYEVLEIAALDVANGNKERLADVVSLTPQAISEMETAMDQFSGANTTCAPVSFTREEWQGLISEVGKLRSWSQEAAVRFILRNEFNESTTSLAATLQESELRIKYGSRDPLVPPPISQAMYDEVADHLEPKILTLITALGGTDSIEVNEASLLVASEAKKTKKEFLQDAVASNPDMPVLRMDTASLQIYWSWRIFKEALMLKANLNVTASSISTSLGEFETNQNHLRDGGGGISPVIRNRFDIFNQWDKVMSTWTVFKELILSQNGQISEMEVALVALVEDLETALDLYTIPDEPLVADTLWPIIAYGAIVAFVVCVICAACVVFCSLRSQKKKPDTSEV